MENMTSDTCLSRDSSYLGGFLTTPALLFISEEMVLIIPSRKSHLSVGSRTIVNIPVAQSLQWIPHVGNPSLCNFE